MILILTCRVSHHWPNKLHSLHLTVFSFLGGHVYKENIYRKLCSFFHMVLNIFMVYLKSCFERPWLDNSSCLLAKSVTAPVLACSLSSVTEMLLNIVLVNYDLNFLLQETIKLQCMKRSKASKNHNSPRGLSSPKETFLLLFSQPLLMYHLFLPRCINVPWTDNTGGRRRALCNLGLSYRLLSI